MFAAKAALAIALTLSFVTPSFAATTDPVFGAVDANAPGCAAGAMRGGKIVFSGAYGLADLKHKTPLTGASLFNITVDKGDAGSEDIKQAKVELSIETMKFKYVK